MASDMTDSQPDGPVGGCDGYVDEGRMYTVTIDVEELTIDLETGDGEWRNSGVLTGDRKGDATPREVALARRLHETEVDYQRQIAALVKERDGAIRALSCARTLYEGRA